MKASHRDLEQKVKELEKARRTERTLKELEQDIKSKQEELDEIENQLEDRIERKGGWTSSTTWNRKKRLSR